MIIVFSGTGNSLLVARRLQERLGGELVTLEGERLTAPEHTLLTVAPGEPVVWVMPVYSWGVPQAVEAFMRLVRFKGAPQSPHFLVMTCGDDIGYADNCWRKIAGRAAPSQWRCPTRMCCSKDLTPTALRWRRENSTPCPRASMPWPRR